MRTRHITELLKRTLLIVAHPDDESVGAGALLQRMQEPCLVFCTDGGPRDEFFWKAFGSRENYVSIRRNEAEVAAAIARVKRVTFLDFCDQELYKHLAQALTELEQLTRDLRPNAILTHAYEGGHPDHDCCAFLGYLLGARQNLPVWEMPLYHRNQQGPQAQQFLLDDGDSISLHITTGELAIKRKMVSAHLSQAHALESFDLTVERFRPQISYDFLRPPVAEVINYEAWQWPVKAAEVCAAFAAFKARVPA